MSFLKFNMLQVFPDVPSGVLKSSDRVFLSLTGSASNPAVSCVLLGNGLRCLLLWVALIQLSGLSVVVAGPMAEVTEL